MSLFLAVLLAFLSNCSVRVWKIISNNETFYVSCICITSSHEISNFTARFEPALILISELISECRLWLWSGN